MAKKLIDKQNVTLALPKDLLRQAKLVALNQEKSLSEFLRESLELRIRESTGYDKAMRRQLKWLKKGFDLGTQGKISFRRDDLYDR